LAKTLSDGFQHSSKVLFFSQQNECQAGCFRNVSPAAASH